MGIYYVICGLWGDITTFCHVKPMFFIALDSIIYNVEPKNTLRISYKKNGIIFQILLTLNSTLSFRGITRT